MSFKQKTGHVELTKSATKKILKHAHKLKLGNLDKNS